MDPNVLHALRLFAVMVLTHFAIDVQFQQDFVAVNKNRHLNKTPVPWYYVMTSHCACHGLAVGYLTGSYWFGAVEFGLHFLIDVAKCEGKTGIHVDQLLHVLCKLAYAILCAVLFVDAAPVCWRWFL